MIEYRTDEKSSTLLHVVDAKDAPLSDAVILPMTARAREHIAEVGALHILPGDRGLYCEVTGRTHDVRKDKLMIFVSLSGSVE